MGSALGLACLVLEGLAIAGVLAALASPALAEPADEIDRWVPTIGVISGVTALDGKARIDSGWPTRDGISGEDTQMTPMVGGEVEIMTPGFTDWMGSPRAFLRGGVYASFASTRDLAKDGNPGDLSDFPPGSTDPDIVDGQGVETSVKIRSPFISAGLGAAFTFEAWERTIRIKTSAEYLRHRAKVTGHLRHAFPLFGAIFLTTADDSRTQTFHALGPGLEVELDAMMLGPFMTSVFTSGRALRIIGDRDVKLTDTDAFNRTTNWNYTPDPWMYQAHVGVRLRWLPE